MTKIYEPLTPDSVFWPKPGDEGTAIEGVFEELEPGKYRETIVLRTPDGIRKVNTSARVRAVLPKMKPGGRYRFTYVGTITLASGQTVKDIKIARVREDADRSDASADNPVPAPGRADDVAL